MRMRVSAGLFCLLFLAMCMSCGGDGVIFSAENDIALGQQVEAQISQDPNYKILPKSQYPQQYAYLEGMKDQILNSGVVKYKELFPWKLTILDGEELNAFATPGGYIYIYTGLIKYLKNPDDLAGVLGHEIAHADERHSSKQLQRAYGIQLLLNVILGSDASQLAVIVAQLAGSGAILKFSRNAESDADQLSVEYLAHTDYACNGAASFFEKMNEEGKGARMPQFMSTHPNPANRVSAINKKAKQMGCDINKSTQRLTNYQNFKNSLP